MMIRLVHFNCIDWIRWSVDHNWGNVFYDFVMRVKLVVMIVLWHMNMGWLGHVHMHGFRVNMHWLWLMHRFRVDV